MNAYDEIMPILPDCYAAQLREDDFYWVEEIRIGTQRPVRLRKGNREKELWPPANQAMVEEILNRACSRSAYAYRDSIAQGYITIVGGHRIGICGTGVMHADSVQTIRMPSSVNIRIAREVIGFADPVIRNLQDSALIIGPPGSGKTTLLRDLIRQISDRLCQTVSVADERGELSAMREGMVMLCLGKRTDVLTGIPKAEAMIMLLRSMSPEWIAVDEITSPSDLEAISMISYCGVKLLATAHGSDLSELRRRPLYNRLLQLQYFRHAIILQQDKTCRMEEMIS